MPKQLVNKHTFCLYRSLMSTIVAVKQRLLHSSNQTVAKLLEHCMCTQCVWNEYSYSVKWDCKAGVRVKVAASLLIHHTITCLQIANNTGLISRSTRLVLMRYYNHAGCRGVAHTYGWAWLPDPWVDITAYITPVQSKLLSVSVYKYHFDIASFGLSSVIMQAAWTRLAGQRWEKSAILQQGPRDTTASTTSSNSLIFHCSANTIILQVITHRGLCCCYTWPYNETERSVTQGLALPLLIGQVLRSFQHVFVLVNE